MKVAMILNQNSLRAVSAVLLTSALSLAGTATARSTVIVEYKADSASTAPDPATQGWNKRQANLVYTSGSENIGGASYNYLLPGSFNTATGTRLTAAWNTTVDPSAMAAPDGWTMTAVIRVIESSMTASSGNAFQSTYFRVFDDKNEFSVAFFNDPDQAKGQGVIFRNLTTGTTATTYQAQIKELDISSDYVTIQLHYDPTTESATLYANGVALLTQGRDVLYALSQFGAGQDPYFIEWGRNVSGAYGEAHWNEVRFETGYAVIPEPSTYALLGAGILGAAFLRRHRKLRNAA